MMQLESSLAELSDVLDLDDDADLAASILARLELDDDPRLDDSRARGTRSWPRLIAVAAAVIAVVVVAVPDARSTVAGWLGFERARIERDPDLQLPDPDDPFTLPGPGDSVTVTIDGRRVLISTIAGTLNITKTIGDNTRIENVDVDGLPGLWIDGAPHQVLYSTSDSPFDVVRVAGDTLLWQDGEALRRIEGFDDRDQALAYASALMSSGED